MQAKKIPAKYFITKFHSKKKLFELKHRSLELNNSKN